MAEDGVIREFLVGLGWKIDRRGQKDFDDALASAKTTALAITAALTGLVATVAKVAQTYEQLHYAGQRAQASVAGMQQFAFAISQVGGGADAARSSLQAVGNFLRSSPGSESFLHNMGVATRDANGELRDTSDLMADLGQQFRHMPYWQARARAGVLGIDENTLQALIRGVGSFGAQYADIYRRIGVNQNQAAQSSVRFMQELRLTGATIAALRDKVSISLMKGIGGDIARFREILIQNSGEISDAITRVVHYILVFGEAFMQLFDRGSEVLSGLYGRFEHLDAGTQQWIETLGALLVAWRLLSRGIMATPIGRVLALGTAILALYDDYQVWKEGGKSLIDWSAWEPGFNALEDAISTVMDAFRTMWPSVRGWVSPLVRFFGHEFVDAFTTLGRVIAGVSHALDDLVHRRFSAAWQDMRDVRSALEASGEEGRAAAAQTGAQYIGRITGVDSDRANQALAYLQSQGLDRMHATAMIANWQQESGLDPTRANGDHRGLEQWSDQRRTDILRGTGIDVWHANFQDSMRAAIWELREGKEAPRYQEFLRNPTLDGATGLFAQQIERSGENPGDPGYDARIKYAHAVVALGAARDAAEAAMQRRSQDLPASPATKPRDAQQPDRSTPDNMPLDASRAPGGQEPADNIAAAIDAARGQLALAVQGAAQPWVPPATPDDPKTIDPMAGISNVADQMRRSVVRTGDGAASLVTPIVRPTVNVDVAGDIQRPAPDGISGAAAALREIAQGVSANIPDRQSSDFGTQVANSYQHTITNAPVSGDTNVTIEQTNTFHGIEQPVQAAQAIRTATSQAGGSIVRNMKSRRV